jgi:hypothetical protein
MSVVEELQRGGLGLLGQSSHEKYMARHFVDMCVGLATFYVLDGPGIESRWRRDFPHPPWGPPGLLCNVCRVSLPGLKRPGLGVNHPPHLATRLRKGNLYLYSPLGPSWPLLGELYHFLYLFQLLVLFHLMETMISVLTFTGV